MRAHGNAFTLDDPGSGFLRNVWGVAWTDVVGCHRGDGVRFRGQPNAANYFHLPLQAPNPVLYHPCLGRVEYQTPATWTPLRLYYQATGPANVFHLGCFDGATRFHDRTPRPSIGLASGGEEVIPLSRRRSALQAFGVPAGVNFGEPDATILFIGAVAAFEVRMSEPGDPMP